LINFKTILLISGIWFFAHISGQALKFSNKMYPDWGFNQNEICADKLVDQVDTVWNVEEHRYTKSKRFS
jgi:dolichyl-phosphate-mannose--protein O-mannosyl transferase